MKVLCELLGDKFREKGITASAVDLIRSMEGGNAAYRAGALKLALRNGRSRGGPECLLAEEEDFGFGLFDL